MTAAAVLSAQALHLRHPGTTREVVRDLHLELRRGEILVIVGPNGSGKSTLLSALARDLAPAAGAVVDGDRRSLHETDRRDFARRVARLPQEPACPPGLTVSELVASGRHPHRRMFGKPSAADRGAIRSALAWMDLEPLAARPVGRLSGGERRRAWLAMVLAQQAEILLLDEPLAGLDLGHRFEVLSVLRELSRDLGRTLAMVLHELDEALRIADRLAVMHRGRLYACGPPERVLNAETVCDVFGLEARVESTPEGLRLTVFGASRVGRFL